MGKKTKIIREGSFICRLEDSIVNNEDLQKLYTAIAISQIFLLKKGGQRNIYRKVYRICLGSQLYANTKALQYGCTFFNLMEYLYKMAE